MTTENIAWLTSQLLAAQGELRVAEMIVGGGWRRVRKVAKLRERIALLTVRLEQAERLEE